MSLSIGGHLKGAGPAMDHGARCVHCGLSSSRMSRVARKSCLSTLLSTLMHAGKAHTSGVRPHLECLHASWRSAAQTKSLQHVGFGWWGHVPSQSRMQVIAHENISRSSNRIKQLERDLLPSGVPNSANRRLSHAIKHALSVHKLTRLYAENAHKLVWFKDKHVAAMLMRVASLMYYRLVAGQIDPGATEELSELLQTMGPHAAKASTVRFIQGAKLCQLIVVVAKSGLQPPDYLMDAWCAEVMREGAKKLLETSPDLISELVAALGLLQWRDAALWRRIGAVAKGMLEAGTSRACTGDGAPGGLLGTEQQLWQRGQQQQSGYQQQHKQQHKQRQQPLHQDTEAEADGERSATLTAQLPPQLPSQQPPRSFMACDLAPLARGLAAVRLRDPALLEALAAAALLKLPLLSVGAVADVAEALVQLGSQQPRLAAAAAAHLVRNMPSSGPEHVPRAVRALGRLAPPGEQHRGLLAAVAGALVGEGWRLPPYGVVQLLEACTECGVEQPALTGRLCRAIAAAGRRGLDEWQPVQLAAAARTLVQLPLTTAAAADAAAAARALAAAALDSAVGLGVPELSDVLSACASLKAEGTVGLANVAAAAAAARPQELGAARRAQLLWALRQLGHGVLAGEVARALEGPGRRGEATGVFD